MRYAKYKPTGIAWLPEVPEGWEMRRGRYAYSIDTGSLDANAEDADGLYPFFTCSMFPKRINTFRFDCEALLVAGNGLVGFTQYYNGKFNAYQRTYVLSDFIEYSPHYLRHYLGRFLRGYADYNSVGSVISFITIGDLRSFPIPFPPLPTQRAIVAFLDEKCGKVDRLVAAKEKEVALLKELKQSMIAEAVTRGVSATANIENAKGAKMRKESLCSSANSAFFASAPAGNPSRRLVPSGIPWLPEVPEGWEVRKMKYLFVERSDKGHPEEAPLCSTQAHGVIPQSLYENRVVVVNKDGLGQLKLVKVGDFVISLRSFQGGIEIAHYQGIISAAYTILEPRDSRNSPYFRYLFKSHAFIQLLQTCVTGIREGQNINYPLLSRKFIPVPPLAEQREIVAHIEAKAAKIDAAVAGLEREIAALKEYKQRLIADVVTGQRRVA